MKPQSLKKYLEAQFVGKQIILYTRRYQNGEYYLIKKPKRFGRPGHNSKKVTAEICKISFRGQRIENTNNLCRVYLTILLKDRLKSIEIQMTDELQIYNKEENALKRFIRLVF